MDTCRERNDQCQLRIVRGRITHMDEPGLFRASRPRCEEKEKRKQERRWVLVSDSVLVRGLKHLDDDDEK